MSNEVLKRIYGKGKFVYLTSPDEAFGPGSYKVTLEVTKEDASEHIKALQDIIKKEVAEEHKARPGQTALLKRANLPYVEDVREAPINSNVVAFKFHSKFKPKLWDKNQKELGADVAVWKDTTMWIDYKASGYNKSVGLGVTLYIQGVQIDELVQGTTGGNGSCPFPQREGGTV
jgi:hypothetical protein